MAKNVTILKTPEFIDVIVGITERLDIMEIVLKEEKDVDLIVDDISIPNLWKDYFNELSTIFKENQNDQVLTLNELQLNKLLFVGDMVGLFFALQGSDEDTEFLTNLTSLLEQINQVEPFDSEECWGYIVNATK